MPDLSAIIQAGAQNPWLFLPAALVLGALHALEPGHSKSLMAAFIVAIRGTPGQAVLLGASAAIGHSLVVWAIAAIGLWLGDKLILDKAEPWLVLVSGLMIVALALRLGWMVAAPHLAHRDAHRHDHGHTHHGHGHAHHAHGGRAFETDAHAAAHARDISERYGTARAVSGAEIAWFGFTGGLLPCPAAIAVLLVCLQLREVTLGASMVLAFSAGLALTLVTIGIAAAWGAQHASRLSPAFDRFAGRLPYLSTVLVLALGLLVTAQGLHRLEVF